MKRRIFLKNTLLGVTLVSAIPETLYAGKPGKHANDKITLGETGIRTSRLAIGTGTDGWNNSSNQTRKLGIDGLPKLLIKAYEKGITFWDSADQYGSHMHLKEALKHLPRKDITILTKTTSRSPEGVRDDLNRFKAEIGTDYVDIVLLHAEKDGKWNKKYAGAMDVLSRARVKGEIRAHGISCHSLAALETAADEPWVQVDLARFNPGAIRMDADVSTVTNVLQRMKKNGKAIVTMKVYGAGRLTHQKDECLKFQSDHDFVDAFTLGIESMEQLIDIEQRMPEVTSMV